jgi:hypothetical protein
MWYSLISPDRYWGSTSNHVMVISTPYIFILTISISNGYCNLVSDLMEI